MTFTAANGCDSVVTLHLTINQPVTNTESLTICASELPYTWNGVEFENEGIDSVTLTASNGCDSLVIMTLTVTRINTEVEIENTTIHVFQENAEYQWFNCETNEWIENATEQEFNPATSGSYACIITLNGCTDTTDCVDVTVGINEYNSNSLTLYPNPTIGIVNVQCTMNNVQWVDGEIQVLDVYGRVLDVVNMADARGVSLQTVQIDLSRYSSGVYFIRWIDKDNVMGTAKVLLNR